MNARQHITLPLAIGVTLALGASTANARMVAGDGASVRAGSSATSHYSAAALKAVDLRWQAVEKFYRHQFFGANATRPDDRSAIRGA